jgi:hypothetical protein
MYPKTPIFQKCIAYLESLPNITITASVEKEPYFSSDFLADGELIINVDRKTVNYVCEIKSGITNNVIEEIHEYFITLRQKLNESQRPLLITSSLSSSVVELLFEKNIEFIDVNGNIYLNNQEFYIVVRHQTSKNSTNKSLEITTAALQVIYALLKQPELIFDEEIAYISGVTRKTVKNTLQKLQVLGYIRPKHRGYKIIDYIKLLERWELGYSEQLWAKLLIGTFHPVGKRNFSEIADDLIKYADIYGYSIGGEFAAGIMTQHLRPISATLHLHKNVNYRQIAVNLKLKPDAEGNIALLKSFGRDEYQENKFGELGKNIVNPLLVHAELLRTGDSRLKETAQLIYNQYIKDIQDLRNASISRVR